MTDSPVAVMARQLMNNFTSGDANRIAGYVASALRVAGYAIVPVEPSEKMLDAAWDTDTENIGEQGNTLMPEPVWKAMLAVAQEKEK